MTRSADLVAAFFGARGQGKSTQAKHYLAVTAPRRLLICDPMDEYGAIARRVESLAQLELLTRRTPEFQLRYVIPTGTPKQTFARFNAFCAIGFERGDLTLLVEELQLVTLPSWGPPAWSQCTLRGRHRRIRLIGLAQRPASVDKNFLSQCTAISTCRLSFGDDVDYMARTLGVPRDRIFGLPRYRYLARDMDTGAVIEADTAPLLAEMKKISAAARPSIGKVSMEG